MIEISQDARYDTPADTIFAIITDLSRSPAWQPDVEFATLASEGPARQGSRIRQVRMVMGRRTEIGLTITRLVPAEMVTWPPARARCPRCGRPTGCAQTQTAAAWSSSSPSTASPRWPITSPAPSSLARSGKCWNASPPSRPAASQLASGSPMTLQLRTPKAGDR